MTRPLLSVIVPAFSRWPEHGRLLESIVRQEFDDWECVIAEDASPDQAKVAEVTAEYAAQAGGRIRFIANPKTLGYDGNFRQLVELAKGQFLFVMGNDDLVAPGAFATVAGTVGRYPNLGFILRAFATFEGSPDNITHASRYYSGERFFPAGPEAVVACYRRAGPMSGLVFHRDSAQALATDRWDGTLFYQHWLLANILLTRDAVYIPDILAYFRRHSPPIFGVAEREQGLYRPGSHPPNADVLRTKSMLAIAQAVETERGVPIAALIERDFANYIYHTLLTQSRVPPAQFREFYKGLGALGLNKYASFHAWYWAMRIFGANQLERTFRLVRRVVGHTPNLSGFVRSAGRPVKHPAA